MHMSRGLCSEENEDKLIDKEKTEAEEDRKVATELNIISRRQWINDRWDCFDSVSSVLLLMYDTTWQYSPYMLRIITFLSIHRLFKTLTYKLPDTSPYCQRPESNSGSSPP